MMSITRLSIALIRCYQVARPGLGLLLPIDWPCRYLPTCSEYAIECLQTRGLLRGGWAALRRILTCHPFFNHSDDRRRELHEIG